MPHFTSTHLVPEVGVAEQQNRLPNKPSGGKPPSSSDAHPELMAGCPLGGLFLAQGSPKGCCAVSLTLTRSIGLPQKSRVPAVLPATSLTCKDGVLVYFSLSVFPSLYLSFFSLSFFIFFFFLFLSSSFFILVFRSLTFFVYIHLYLSFSFLVLLFLS